STVHLGSCLDRTVHLRGSGRSVLRPDGERKAGAARASTKVMGAWGRRAGLFLVVLVAVDEIEEELVDARVGGEFGMEGGGQEVAFADQDGEAVAGGQGLDGGAG